MLVNVVITQKTTNDAIHEERFFNQYLRKFGLRADESKDFEKWKKNVIDNFKLIEKHNKAFRKGEELFERGVNHLSHLSEEEFKKTLIKYEKPEGEVETLPIVKPEDLKELPEYFNWVDKGVVHDVVNQKHCGSCYVFATIAAIESHTCLYNNICEKLSEQEGMECSIKGCNGGTDSYLYSYTQLKNGATYANYTYQAKVVNDCDAADKRPRVPGTKVKQWRKMPKDAESIRYYLYKNGPMSVVFDIHPNFKDYKTGIYSKTEGPVSGHHYVLLVGYGTEKGVDYFIYKNSWG